MAFASAPSTWMLVSGNRWLDGDIILDVPTPLIYDCGIRGIVMKSVLSDKHFHNEQAAYDFVEARVWPNGPVCPHCGGVERISAVTGKTARAGLKRCGQCKKQFRATVGTVFESSHIPLHKWFQAAHLLASSKKGISSHQLHRTLKVTYKPAWFMSHLLRGV